MIDVGINKTESGIVGDVDFDEVSKVAKAITPVPGGVGPMTIACFLIIQLSASKELILKKKQIIYFVSMKLFLILGNQLFSPKYLKEFSDHIFLYVRRQLDYVLFKDITNLKFDFFSHRCVHTETNLKSKKFKLFITIVIKILKFLMKKKLEKIIKEKKIKEISFFEIEDIFFEKKIKSFLKKKNISFNEIRSPMFLTSRDEFKKYLKSTKKPFMANFYKINRSKFDILMNKDGTPKGGKWI